MRPSELATFLVSAIAERLNVLITGAPGIGKSDIVAQSAEHAGAELLISHPAVADPTDARGLPWIGEGGDVATFLPFGELAHAMNATAPLVWFLDDLGQATPAVQASFMQLLLARRVNGHALPDCVSFIAATNRRTDRAGVTGILEPVKSRFGSIVELNPHIDDWCNWAFGHAVPAVLIAFLRFRQDLLCAFSPSADLVNCPLPRTWGNAARLYLMDLPEKIKREAIGGAVGDAAANEFFAFERMHKTLPSVDAILIDPNAAPVPSEPSALYATATALGMRANVQTFGRIARFAERMMDAGHGEFSALLLRDCVRRDPGIPNTPEFVKLATGELGSLIGGHHA
jgi:hypothetical protein